VRKDEEIKKKWQEMIAMKSYIFPAKVKSINSDKAIVEFEGLQLPARLTSVINTNEERSFIIPELESDVLVAIINGDKKDLVIIAYSIIDELQIKANQITFNNGDKGGLINIEELTTKLNKLVSEVNTLKNQYNSHIHATTATVGTTTVVGVISPTISRAVSISEFDSSNYIDDKILH